MNVLSLFDGMSCGQQALERAGIKVTNYFASEIDKYAIEVTMKNYPNTIQLGSVINIDTKKLPKIDLLIGGSPCQSFSFAGKRKGMITKDFQEIINLNQYLKLKNENFEFDGQSYLFWEFVRILNEIKPKYFLLENVLMVEKWQKIINKTMGVNPIIINSALLSAQNRKRLYWTNIGMIKAGLFNYPVSIIEQPKDKKILLRDILEKKVNKKYYFSDNMLNFFENAKSKPYNNGKINFKFENEKASPILARGSIGITSNIIVHNMQPRSGNPKKGGTGHLSKNGDKSYCLDTKNSNAIEIKKNYIQWDKNNTGHKSQGQRAYFTNKKSGTLNVNSNPNILDEGIRKLTPLECERLQTVKDNYTNFVSDTQRYKMLGNGWTVDVISYIFKYLKNSI